MNKRQLEVQKVNAAEEAKVLRRLKQVYRQASKDCETKIRELSSRTDMENLQSIIYQKQYQEVIKKQIDGVLNTLNNNSFTTISDYLGTSYENGFLGTLYDLQGQGVPLIFPIDQERVVNALQVESKLSQGLYKRLGEDTDYLKKSIKAELSRGVSSGISWNEIARRVANGMNSPFNKAYNRAVVIARTEGHRIQNQSALDCQKKAKGKGADIVKQWDSTLDGKTRPHHTALDRQVREIEEPFEVDGLEAMYPGNFGIPGEDCNCRCCLLQRARWALSKEEYYTKWNGDKNELVTINAKDYTEFKETAQTLNKSLDYRIMNYKDGDYAIKERVTFLEAIMDMPDKVKHSLKDTIVNVGSEGCAYDPITDTIYIGKNASKREVIHEIGHAIEEKLFNKEDIDFLKRQCSKGLSLHDVESVVAQDSIGNITKILVLKSDKLLAEYQGRIYARTPLDAISEDGSIDLDTMKEYISVAVEEYFSRPGRMKERDKRLYDFVKGVLYDDK